MTKLLLTLFIVLTPLMAFAQENPTYTFNKGGIFFMIFAWISILTWNILCFNKLLTKKK